LQASLVYGVWEAKYHAHETEDIEARVSKYEEALKEGDLDELEFELELYW